MLIPLRIAFGMDPASGGLAGGTSAGARGTGHVILAGAGAHPEPGSDVGIGQAAGDEVGHIALGRGEARPPECGPSARASSPAGPHGSLLHAQARGAWPRWR